MSTVPEHEREAAAVRAGDDYARGALSLLELEHEVDAALRGLVRESRYLSPFRDPGVTTRE